MEKHCDISCKHCENFDLQNNTCMIDGSKGYVNQKCVHMNCEHYQTGSWNTNTEDADSARERHYNEPYGDKPLGDHIEMFEPY